LSNNDAKSLISAHPSNLAVRIMMQWIIENKSDFIDLDRLICNTNPHIGPILDMKINDFKKYDWVIMSKSNNPAILKFIEKHPDKISWNMLSENACDDAIDILENNKENINWRFFSSNSNPRAIEIIKNNKDKINWINLRWNHHPEAIKLVEENKDKYSDFEYNTFISLNPYAIHLISLDNLDKLSTIYLSKNKNAMDILMKYPELINIESLLCNSNAIPYLEIHMEQIGEKYKNHIVTLLIWLSNNVNGCSLIQKMLDKDLIKKTDFINFLLAFNPNRTLSIFISTLLKYPAFKHLFDLDYKAMSKIRSKIIYEELISKAFHPSRVEKWLDYHLKEGRNI
jgi:hypothetical protein